MILVTGANGQVGQCFRHLAAKFPNVAFLFAGSGDLDISDEKAVSRFFSAKKNLTWVINCAAYTAVDKAESEPILARKINVSGVKYLAEACAENGIFLFHFSSDYVYHSQQNTGYKETDAVRPKSVYASSKLAGERAALKVLPDNCMILRTSWVYAAHGQNFVKTMLRLSETRSSISVVSDQIGTPTYAPDLALAVLNIIQMVEKRQRSQESIAGIYNYSNEGVTSWYDFAQAIFDLKNLPCKVLPIETSQYPTPAARPAFSVLNKTKFREQFQLEIPHWQHSLNQCLETL